VASLPKGYTVKSIPQDMEQAIQTLFQAILADYAKLQQNSLFQAILADYAKLQQSSYHAKQLSSDDVAEWDRYGAIQSRMFQEFSESLTYSVGDRYIRIISGTQRSVWGFIIKEEDKGSEFRRGDIMMAKSCRSPSLNKARGNIFTDLSQCLWTGPKYIR
jgi:hypothetical protein